MRFEERTVKDVTIVAVHGDITLNKGSDVELKDKVRRLIEQGRTKLVLDLSQVGYMDSAGLGELVQAYATVKKHGGILKLLGLTKRIKELLAITKLVTIFESFPGDDAAVASFYPVVVD
jgi:anti-sigma B factor antagonist